eukprot:gene22479-biopygen14782
MAGWAGERGWADGVRSVLRGARPKKYRTGASSLVCALNNRVGMLPGMFGTLPAGFCSRTPPTGYTRVCSIWPGSTPKRGQIRHWPFPFGTRLQARPTPKAGGAAKAVNLTRYRTYSAQIADHRRHIEARQGRLGWGQLQRYWPGSTPVTTNALSRAAWTSWELSWLQILAQCLMDRNSFALTPEACTREARHDCNRPAPAKHVSSEPSISPQGETATPASGPRPPRFSCWPPRSVFKTNFQHKLFAPRVRSASAAVSPRISPQVPVRAGSGPPHRGSSPASGSQAGTRKLQHSVMLFRGVDRDGPDGPWPADKSGGQEQMPHWCRLCQPSACVYPARRAGPAVRRPLEWHCRHRNTRPRRQRRSPPVLAPLWGDLAPVPPKMCCNRPKHATDGDRAAPTNPRSHQREERLRTRPGRVRFFRSYRVGRVRSRFSHQYAQREGGSGRRRPDLKGSGGV